MTEPRTPDPAAHAMDRALAFVLVRPQMGENIGAAARAMWNFGLDRMRVTGPRDGWPNPKAVAMASGAGRLLDEARIFDTTAEAVADRTFVYATTARERGLTKTVMTPEAAMADAARRAGEGERVAVLFGPERSGLENEDVILANVVVTVDVNPAFPSLNLAQCVLLCAYEWRRAAGEVEAEVFEPGRGGLATRENVGRMIAHLEEELEAAAFFYPEGKAPAMKASLRNLFNRAPLTDQDVRTMRGVIRALAEGPRRKG
ncbi:MAG: RNA methyltransferase [Pseudomonadota bacterium]